MKYPNNSSLLTTNLKASTMQKIQRTIRHVFPTELHVGLSVMYIPNYAIGIDDHPDVEHGFISSVNTTEHGTVVFVRYIRRDGKLGATGKATPIENLFTFA